MEEKKVIRAALYIRVSTEEQAKHGYSLEAQKDNLINYCKDKGYKITNVYADEGKSARTKLKNRKALLQLIDDAQTDKFDMIVMWKLDRWFRNVSDYYKVQEILTKYKIDWECSGEDYNTTTSNGKLYLNIKLSIAQNESDQTSDRIKFNFDNMVKNKQPITGTMPFGYKIDDSDKRKKIIIDDEKKEIVTYIFETYPIVNSLHKTAKLVSQKYNMPFSPKRVKHMLKNTMYYGEYRNVIDYCPPYVTKETFAEIQSFLKKDYKNNKKRDYIFSGLIKCKHCQGKMAGGYSKTKIYRCGRNHNYHDCINSKSLNEKKLEDYLIENIKSLSKVFLENKEALQDKTETTVISKNINNIEKKMKRLNELYIEGAIDKIEYTEKYNKLLLDKKDLEQKLDFKPPEKYNINNLPDNVLEMYNKLNDEKKHSLWLKFIDCIEYDSTKETLEERVFINFK